MSRITRLAVLAVGLMSLFAMLSASAGAVTWSNMGTTTFTATGGAGTLTSTASTLNCTGSNATGDAPLSAITPIYSVTGTVTFTGCSLGGVATGVDCGYTLTGSTATATQVTGNVDVSCGIFQFGARICSASSSSLHGIYHNPTTTAGDGTLTVTTGGVTVTNGTSGTCPLGNGDLGHLSPLHFTTGPHAPWITLT